MPFLGSSSAASWERGQPLFKYVDLEDRHFLDDGSLKIGTLRGYASLESARADPFENQVSAAFPSMDQLNPDHLAFLNANGIDIVGGGGHRFINMGFERDGPNHHCLCFSYRGGLPDERKVQAVYRIDDSNTLCQRICELNPEMGESILAPVVYNSRELVAPTLKQYEPNPFLKPSSFAKEHEVRLLGIAAIPDDADPIFGKNDATLAKLMVRIR